MSDGTSIANTDPNVAAQLPPDLAVIKMENDTIMAAAAARPRNNDKIKTELTSLMTSYPEFCEQAVYHKPVGKDDAGHMKFATGLSVRAAEALAECYGYNRVRSDITIIDDDRVKVEATFVDFQRGRIWQDGGIVTKFYKGRNGKMNRHPDDRFFNVVVRAEASKRVREVITRSVNAALKVWFFDECEKRVNKILTEDKVRQIIAGFSKFKVTQEQLEKRVGKPIRAGWTIEDKQLLLGIFNAINDGETTVSEAFEDVIPQEQKKQTSGDVSLDDLTGSNTHESPNVELSAEQAALIDECHELIGQCNWSDEYRAKFLKESYKVDSMEKMTAAQLKAFKGFLNKSKGS